MIFSSMYGNDENLNFTKKKSKITIAKNRFHS